MPAFSWKKLSIGSALSVLLCVASHATTVPTSYDPTTREQLRKIFTQVLQKSIASKPGLNICLPPLFGYGDTVVEPVNVNVESDSDSEAALPGVNLGGNRAAQFKALETAGLVSSTESTRTTAGKTRRMLAYRRTPKGLATSQGPSICYARGELDKLVKWKGPAVLGAYEAAFVYYTVKSSDIADWAKSPDIQAAFPTTVAIIKGEPAKERQTVIDLSSEGWDIAEYAKYVQME